MPKPTPERSEGGSLNQLPPNMAKLSLAFRGLADDTRKSTAVGPASAEIRGTDARPGTRGGPSRESRPAGPQTAWGRKAGRWGQP